MHLMRGVLRLVSIAAGGALAPMSLYLLALAAASFFAPRRALARAGRKTRFAILIPAHNEELLLGKLLASLASLDYPSDLLDVHVVADNCDDRTAEIAAQAGAYAHVRQDPVARGKGHALNWLIDRLLTAERTGQLYDAFVILDADSTVSPDFLTHMAAALAAGNSVAQGFNDIANPTESWASSLRYVAFCLICYLRRLGMSALGLSVALLGNGMCLSREVIERFRWDPSSVTEDHELHFRLLEHGLKVAFVPEAHVYSQMPTSLRSARTQNLRWESGKLQLMTRYTKRLVWLGVRTGNWSMLITAMELTMPPFSLAFASTLAVVASSALMRTSLGLRLGVLSLLAQCLYTARGLAVMPVQAPKIYLSLLYAPLFIAWKAGVYLSIALGSATTEWVRTTRNA